MADDELIPPEVEANITRGGIPKPKKKNAYVPSYRMVGDSKIPVAKRHGSLWKSRRDAGVKARSPYAEAWAEAEKYYANDQLGHRGDSNVSRPSNRKRTASPNDTFTETENVVFANTTTLLPIVYAKNPTVEVTATKFGSEDVATLDEKVINALINKKEAPGINLKPKARKCTLITLLKNESWIKLDWITKEFSAEQAMSDLAVLTTELKDAKDTKQIEATEGKLKALEDRYDMLRPSGPMVRVVQPEYIVRDPACCEHDLSDANWVMESDMLPTTFILAQFATKSDDKEQYMSIYEPTHVMRLKDGDSIDEQVNNFTLFNKADGSEYGYDDQSAFDCAKYTKVWYVWDKITRRVYMYNDKDWTWPIWVWDDPLRLPRFFPYFKLAFHEAVRGSYAKGEVTYYLDQQDAINEINDHERRSRDDVITRGFYIKGRIEPTDVDAVTRGRDRTWKGVDVPEGMTLDDCFSQLTPAMAKFPELFNKQGKYAAIDRISSLSDVLRGAQFKTNTTNDAVQSYQNAAQIRIDEKTDAIEDWIGEILYNMLLLCHQNMAPEDVALLIGDEAAGWQQIESVEYAKQYTFTVAAGSTAKQNSQAKKQEAIQVGQVMGQFAGVVPAAAVVMLKMFENAFDDMVIDDQDWKEIRDSMNAQMQRGDSTGGQGGQPGAEGAQGGTPEEQQAREAIGSLPPEGKQALQQLVDSGMPPSEALKQVLAKSQQPQQ